MLNLRCKRTHLNASHAKRDKVVTSAVTHFRHPLRQKKPAPITQDTLSPKKPRISRPLKRIVIAVLAGSTAVALAPTVHASVFDPLLKILLPFYQPNPSQASNTDEAVERDDTDTMPEAEPDEMDSLPSQPDSLDDSASQATSHTDSELNIPAVLLDDTLIAHDAELPLDSPDLYALLDAEFAADRDNIPKALALYKAESFKNNAVSVFERALALSIEYETPAESLAFATAWQSKNPEHIPAWFYVTHLALKAGEYRQAAAMLSTILHYDPRADLAQILTGITPTNTEDQRALFMALQELGEDNASVSVLRAGLLRNLDAPSVALLHVNQALKLEPNNLAFITLKLDILKSLDKMTELWDYLHQVRKKLPHEKELYLYEVRYLLEKGNLDSAWQLLLTASTNTNNPDVILLSGLVGLDSARYTEAINMFAKLINNPEFSNRAHYYTGIGYERLGDTVRARRHFERVDSPDLVLDARTKVVGFYLLENNTDAAINALVWLRDEYGSFATDSYILQAEIYMRQGDKDKASNLLTAANREYPNDDRLLHASFVLLADELSADDKRETIGRLMALDSFNPTYQLLDAKMRLSDNPDDARALATIDEISRISISDPNYDSALQLDALMALGDHALKKADYHHVIELLQPVYDVEPNLDTGILLLRAHQGLGDTEAVNSMLADLQSRFSVTDANALTDSQNY